MQSCTLMHMQHCTWKCYIIGQTSTRFSNLRCGNDSLSCTHTHLFAQFLHLSLTRILKAVVISRPHPPFLNKKAITIGFSPIPVAWQHCPHPHLPLALRLLLSQIPFSSLVPLLPFTVAADSLSFSILSAASLFRSSHL